MSRVALLTGETITLHSAAATLPVPTNADTNGAAVTAWRHGDLHGYSDVDIEITASAATVLTATGGLGLYRVADGRLSLVGVLNNGQDISIQKPGTPVVGFCQYVAGAGIADRLIVGGIGGTCTPTGGATVTVRATPIGVL